MRLNDAVIGAALLAFSIVLMIHVSIGWDWLVETGFTGFPRAAPGRPGPALFPFTLGALFAICGLALIAKGLQQGGPWVELRAWASRRSSLLNAAGVVGAVVVYQYLAEPVGFLPLASVILFLLMKRFDVGTRTAALVSLACALFIHTLFVKFLLVPLPWGLLEPFAW